MILTNIEEYPNQLLKGKDYFCLEVYINLKTNSVSYAVVNEYAEIAVYESNKFEIKQDILDGMIFMKDKSINSYIIRLRAIKELDDICNDINGIWGIYNDGNKDIEDKIHAIVKKQAKKEGFQLDKVVAV